MGLKPVRVSQLNGYIKRILSSDPILGNIAVLGEISNFKHHSNGHVYFSLKDEGAKVNCFLPGDVYGELAFGISDGMEVTAKGYISLYERGGTYSLNIRELQAEGAGGLAAAFEKLKQRLAAEGLFDKARKRPLPSFPKQIGLVTSATGAAVEDMVKIITERNHFVNILIYPTLVQGPEAAAGIAGGIDWFNTHMPEVDLLIVGRGGGSVEELWAFNEEAVARAVFRSQIPIVSAVGHETDVTIADFVADVRAETPTAAAQLSVPDTRAIRVSLDGTVLGMGRGLMGRIAGQRLRLDRYSAEGLQRLMDRRLMEGAAETGMLFREMERGLTSLLSEREQALRPYEKQLAALNPLNVLKRGYSLLTDEAGKTVSSAAGLRKGDRLSARFYDGRADLTVESEE